MKTLSLRPVVVTAISVVVVTVCVTAAVTAGASGSSSSYYACLKAGKLTKVGTTAPTCTGTATQISWPSQIPAVVPPEEQDTWAATLPATVGEVDSTTQITAGSTLKGVSATLTGNLSSCTSGFIVNVFKDFSSPDNYIATWFESSGSNYTTPLAATSNIGTSITTSSSGSLSMDGTCMNGGGPVSWPSGVSVTVTFDWTHPLPTNTFS